MVSPVRSRIRLALGLCKQLVGLCIQLVKKLLLFINPPQASNGVRSKPSFGFTLIEVVIVLAITAALVAIAFAGQAGLRARANFSDGLERTNSLVQRAKSDAYNTVTGSGQIDANTVFFAKVVMFTKNPTNTITVYTVTKNTTTNAINPLIESSVGPLPNGILNTDHTVDGVDVNVSAVCFAFTQEELSAEPIGYIISPCTTTALRNTASYSSGGAQNASIELQDETGATAKNKGSINFTAKDMTIEKKVTQ